MLVEPLALPGSAKYKKKLKIKKTYSKQALQTL